MKSVVGHGGHLRMSRGRDDPRGGALDSTNEGVGLDGPLRMSVGRYGPSRSGEPVGQCERREGGGMVGHDHQGHAGPGHAGPILEGELVDHRTRRSLFWRESSYITGLDGPLGRVRRLNRHCHYHYQLQSFYQSVRECD